MNDRRKKSLEDVFEKERILDVNSQRAADMHKNKRNAANALKIFFDKGSITLSPKMSQKGKFVLTMELQKKGG